MNFFKKLFFTKKPKVEEAKIILEERSPLCPITAIVEQDNRVAFFYLYGPDQSHFAVKSCWIRNLQGAPVEVEEKLMDEGIPPMMPKKFCKFPEGQQKLEKDNLRIIWTEEGDSAALLENNEIIAIIPIWGGQNGFFGYARDCISEGTFASELKSENVFPIRIKKAEAFWKSLSEDTTPFMIEQPKLLKYYNETFGKSDKYYAIDNSEWPPKGLYLRKGESKIVFATVGLSLIPMPTVEMYYDNPFDFHRIEFGIILEAKLSDDDLQNIAEWISGITDIPWDNITFLGEGHTVSFKPLKASKFSSAVLTKKLNVLPKPNLQKYRDSEINFLWMVPISERERNHIMENGSDEVIEKLGEIGNLIYSLDRNEVV
ncbi:MAG: suppressor of fused domain protein [Bacteroidota bacterium]